ncbi:hypothetical protein [Streptomyces sp. V1I1]|uniref:hypothetical protein n=1 Tax=Streptomyces sp. V1I1 TaxID=3042272 RepID=UPI002782C632|nr:hypothetical protein [Streptomyces sp. V1I1]MDQ0938428.1 transposase [Streptomyces sp. V1I1]
MLGDGHAGFGGRVGETHREQSRQGAPARPNNLGEAVERLVSHHRALLRDLVEPEPVPPQPYPPGKFLDRLRDTHAAVRAQVGQGLSLREVARRLGLGRNTVRKYARAATPEAMLHGQWQDRTGKLDPYRPYLEQRIAEGCTNLSRLHREIQERGARCSYSTLRDYVHPLRPGRRPASGRSPMARPPSPREATRWIMSHPDHLRTDDQLQLKALLTRSPELTAATSHVRTFATIMSNREGDRLRGWIADVCADEQCGLTAFAAGLITDLDAVIYGLSTDWSSGPVEGRVNDLILWNLSCQERLSGPGLNEWLCP